jgi:hypothetical protein
LKCLQGLDELFLNDCGQPPLRGPDRNRKATGFAGGYLLREWAIFRHYLINNQRIQPTTFLSMLNTAAERGFTPEFILFDTWYASLENLKFIRSLDWLWLTRLECSRHINPDKTKNRPVKQVFLSE